MKKILFCFFILQLCLSEGFIRSDQTNVISILNDAAYSSADKDYGSTGIERVNNRLNEIQSMFASTKQDLQNISIIQANDHYCIFQDSTTMQAYFVIRGTIPSKASDIYNDAQMYFEFTPVRTQEIQNVMSGKMTDLANSGYKINVSGHSLGGSLALFACANNQWVSHCEVHNPYLDEAIVSKLGPIIDSNPNMANKILIQRTDGDLVSHRYAKTAFNNTLYSSFEIPENVKGLNKHSSLNFFAEAHLLGEQEVAFEGISFSISEQFLNLCKEKFGNYIAMISQCNQTQYYDFSSVSCLACPLSKACKNAVLGPYNCPSQQYSSSSGECLPCSAGKYTEFVGQSVCFTCPQGSKCVKGLKTLCEAGTFNSNLGDDRCYYCKEGMHQNKLGQLSCNSCPAGSKCPFKDQGPIPCPIGTAGPNINDTQCNSCSNGYYQTETGKTYCNSCPAGSKCPYEDQGPIPCPIGTAGPYIKDTKCYSCSNGYYQTETGKTSCNSCPVGHMCPKKDSEPIPCPAGTFNPYSSSTVCDVCKNGTAIGQSSCSQSSFLKESLNNFKGQ